MWSSRLVWKLFLTYAAFNLGWALVFVIVVSRWTEQLVLRQVGEQLHKSALLVRSDVGDRLALGRTPELQQYIRQLGEDVEMRITLVDTAGAVLADSEKASLDDVARMDNHRNRKELTEATMHGVGMADRPSATMGQMMKYMAVRVGSRANPLGFVRLSTFTSDIQNQVSSVKRLIWAVAGFVSVLVLALTYWIVARLMQPVRILTQAADAVSADDYTNRIDVHSRDELGVMAAAFNKMNERMASRVTKLRQAGEQLATVLEGMVEGVLAVGEDGNVLFANSAAGQLLSFTAEKAQGTPFGHLIQDNAIRQIIREQFAKSDPSRIEIDTPSGSGRVLGISSTRLPGDPCPGIVLVLQNVTALRRLESLRHEFVANVSHELKTPLSSIKAYAETLKNGAINDPEHSTQFVQRIVEQADRLHQLILDLLSLARIESDQQMLDIVTVPVAKVVQASIAANSTSADAKKVLLNATSPSTDLAVRADEEGLRQILDNLLDNAIKYSADNSSVEIRWFVARNEVIIEVQDSGIGIAEQHHARVFERFFRVDKARSRELGGTGLGLSIVKHLAQSFGGNVSVESTLGKGATFRLVLPNSTRQRATGQ